MRGACLQLYVQADDGLHVEPLVSPGKVDTGRLGPVWEPANIVVIVNTSPGSYLDT